MENQYNNYDNYIKSVIEQVDSISSEKLNVFEQKYLKNIIKNYATTMRKYAEKENFFCETSILELIRLSSKWTYHKCMDLMHSTIPQNYWDDMLIKINITIYEFYKLGKVYEYSYKRINKLIEEEVNLCYSNCVNDLHDRKRIDENTFATAIMQSNIDDFLNIKETIGEKIQKYFKKSFSILIMLCGAYCCLINTKFNIQEMCFITSILAIGCYMLFINEIISKSYYLYTIFGCLILLMINNQFIPLPEQTNLINSIIIVFSIGNILGYNFGNKNTELY